MRSRIYLLILGLLVATVVAGNPASAQRFPIPRWPWDEPRDQVGRGPKTPCSFQGRVGVNEFKSYDQGREAAEHMRELADELRKLAESANAEDKRSMQWRSPRAHELLHQLNTDFSAVAASNRSLRGLLMRNPSSQYQELEELLQLEEITASLERLDRELASEVPDLITVGYEADQLKEHVEHWEEGVKQAGKKFCLR